MFLILDGVIDRELLAVLLMCIWVLFTKRST